MFEEDCVAYSHVASVGDINLMAPIMIPRITNVEPASRVGSPRLPNGWDKMCLDLACKRRERVGVVAVLFP